MDERDIAMEEWKQLQTIIGRFDTLEFQIRGWLLVLLGGLITALYSEKTNLQPFAFFVIALFAIGAFCLMELTTRRPKRIAITRAYDVEQSIRSNGPYDSPGIAYNISEGAKSTIWNFLGEFKIATIWPFYILLFLFVVLMWLIRR